jgi:hypothetical protein
LRIRVNGHDENGKPPTFGGTDVKRSLSGWILSCILSTSTLAFSQIATTSLRGTIKDPSGAVVPGARITLVDKATGSTLSATSSNTGFYDLLQIPPATYTITVSAPGFGDQTKVAELLVNQPATVDFTLTVQSSTVTVDVSAEAQTLNTTDASIGNSQDNALIQALPSETRNVPDLLSLQPGVLYLGEQNNMSDSRQGAVNGGRSDQGNVTMDGIDDNDQVNGYAFLGVLRETQDSVEEFRVTTGDANADQGRSSGAQISLVTKSGTNKFHGAVYEYNRPTITVANDWFNKQAQLSSGLPNVPGKLIRNIFGGAVGGPIKKDKLFFFANYEATRQAENTQVTRTTPTASYDNGTIQYLGDTAGGAVVTQAIPASDVVKLDAACQICKTSAYPFPKGPNPNALGYFKSEPAANGLTEGDGLNEGSFTFSSPSPVWLNTSIARLDYTPNDKHRLFVRGNLQDDTTYGVEQFPGQPPSSITRDNSKGFTAGDTWSIRSNLINDIRYGYVRQGYGITGAGGNGIYTDFRFLSDASSEERNTVFSVPVNNIIDNLNWTKGKHSIQVGANWRLVHQNHSSNALSFDSGTSNPYWLGGNPPDPSAILGDDPVDGGFFDSYLEAYANLVGTIPQITDEVNYKLTSATAGTTIPSGGFINRHFTANEFEWYVQDAWHATPNLIVTLGLRHTILQTPYETSGQEVAPTVDTHAWFLQRETSALSSQIYEPDLEFAPAGKHFGKPGYWPTQEGNLAPRLAFAYSPDSKTAIRAGAGIYYDHYGEGLVYSFDQNGSFGESSSLSNPAGVYGYEGNATHPAAPRFLSRTTLPNISLGKLPTSPVFPYTPPEGLFQITWGLDSRLKTPYSEAMDFSVQRQIPGGFTVEAAYVGRMGRHLLQSLDLAEPVDYVDPKGGGDYFTAGPQLSHQVDVHNGNFGGASTNFKKPPVYVAPIKYFEDVFPFMAGVDFSGESATEAVYNNEWAPYRSNLGATTALSDIDFYCYYGCPAGWQSHFWQNQFSSLYALDTVGMSSYNAGQLTLRHPTSHGVEFDFSYTYSRSIDMGSDAERATEFGSGSNGTASFSDIINTWKPYLNRGVSDFDTTHLITADGVYQLPFGRGKMLLGNANAVADAIVGGWQLSGINRWTGGLPFSFGEPGWSTDWQIESFAVETAPVKTHRHFDQNGNPQYFDNAAQINTDVSSGGAGGGNVRLPYPGEAGMRNTFRGDRYFDIDNGLDKSWRIAEFGTLKFGWEVYNVTNSARFDPASVGGQLTSGNLGVASSLLTTPRRMQFSLRYDF